MVAFSSSSQDSQYQNHAEILLDNPFQKLVRNDPCFEAALAAIKRPISPVDLNAYQQIAEDIEHLDMSIKDMTSTQSTPSSGFLQKIKKEWDKRHSNKAIAELQIKLESKKKSMQMNPWTQYKAVNVNTAERWGSILQSYPAAAILAALGVDPRITARSMYDKPLFGLNPPIESTLGSLMVRPRNANSLLISLFEGCICTSSILAYNAKSSHNSEYSIKQPISYLTLVACLDASSDFRKIEIAASLVAEQAADILFKTYLKPQNLCLLVKEYAVFFPYESAREANLARSKGSFVNKMFISSSTQPAVLDCQRPWYGVLNQLLDSPWLNINSTGVEGT